MVVKRYRNMHSKRLAKHDTIIEKINLLKECASSGNMEAQILIELLEDYLPRMLKNPNSVTVSEINRYNELVNSNIESDHDLRKALIITK